jgi:hypothetical protein
VINVFKKSNTILGEPDRQPIAAPEENLFTNYLTQYLAVSLQVYLFIILFAPGMYPIIKR